MRRHLGGRHGGDGADQPRCHTVGDVRQVQSRRAATEGGNPEVAVHADAVGEARQGELAEHDRVVELRPVHDGQAAAAGGDLEAIAVHGDLFGRAVGER